jgi:hypothetical protein
MAENVVSISKRYTVDDAAEELGLSVATVRREIGADGSTATGSGPKGTHHPARRAPPRRLPRGLRQLMPADRFPEHGTYVGGFWLSRRRHSRQWCRTWFDAAARQTRRASLGTDDLESAKVQLSGWYVLNAELRHERPADVLLRDLVLRHVEHYAPKKRSANQIRRSLLALDDRFPGVTVAGLTPGMLEDFGHEVVARSPTHSTETARRVLTDVRVMLNTARKRGEILAVPFVPVEKFERGEGASASSSPRRPRGLYLAAGRTGCGASSGSRPAPAPGRRRCSS